MKKTTTLAYFAGTFIKKVFSPSLIRPAFCSIKLTELCNFKCIMCDSGFFGNKGNELTTAEWKSVIDELTKLNYLGVRFTGGEPLLRRDILELIEYASARNLRVSIATNGYLIDRAIARSFAELGVSRVTISINGLGKDHDHICGVKGAFSRVEKNISILMDKGISCAIAITLMDETIDSMPQVIDFAEKIGICVSINLIDNRLYFQKRKGDRNKCRVNQEKLRDLIQFLKIKRKENPSLLSVPFVAFDFIPKYFMDPIQKQIPCMSSLIETLIDSKGNFYGGCYALPPLDNVCNKSLKEILSSSAYKKRAIKAYRKQCPGCACGYELNLVFMLSQLFREILFDWKFLSNRVF